MKRIGVIAVAALGLAPATAGGATPIETGLYGHVCRASMPVPRIPIPRASTPVPAATSACVRPLHTVLVFTRPGRTYRIASERDGSYRAALSPGVYRVQLPFHVGVSAPLLRPSLVRVRSGHYDHLDFYLRPRIQ